MQQAGDCDFVELTGKPAVDGRVALEPAQDISHHCHTVSLRLEESLRSGSKHKLSHYCFNCLFIMLSLAAVSVTMLNGVHNADFFSNHISNTWLLEMEAPFASLSTKDVF